MKYLQAIVLVLLGLLVTPLYVEAANMAPFPAPAPLTGSGPTTLCDIKCKVRCSKASRKSRCLKYCGICCSKCNCVPSGTYGNKDECPCYRDMLTTNNTPKCP